MVYGYAAFEPNANSYDLDSFSVPSPSSFFTSQEEDPSAANVAELWYTVPIDAVSAIDDANSWVPPQYDSPNWSSSTSSATSLYDDQSDPSVTVPSLLSEQCGSAIHRRSYIPSPEQSSPKRRKISPEPKGKYIRVKEKSGYLIYYPILKLKMPTLNQLNGSYLLSLSFLSQNALTEMFSIIS